MNKCTSTYHAATSGVSVYPAEPALQHKLHCALCPGDTRRCGLRGYSDQHAGAGGQHTGLPRPALPLTSLGRGLILCSVFFVSRRGGVPLRRQKRGATAQRNRKKEKH